MRRALDRSRLAVILCAGLPSFYRLWDPDQTTVCRFPLQIDRSSSRRFSSPRSSSSYIIILTLQITQEEIDVMTRSGWPKLDNLDYLFWNSSIRCSWTLFTHVTQSPTLFVRVLLLTGLGDDGLDLCFSLLLPDFLKRSGERRRFIVMRGGSVLAIWWRIFKVSRRNYCNYYNLPIYLRDLSSKVTRYAQSRRISPWK